MNRFFRITALALLLFSFTAYAQFSKFKAKDGLATAVDAAEQAGLTNPKLTMVGTANQELEIGGKTFKFSFDWADGQANLWAYMFVSEDGTQIKAFGVVKAYGVLFQAQEINPNDLIENNDILDPFTPIGDVEWMDSPEMTAKLMETAELIAFLENHSEPDELLVMMFKNTRVDYVAKGEVYWGFQVTDGDDSHDSTKSCSVHAVNGTVFCLPEEITSVDEPEIGKINLYPNPAVSMATLDLPDEFNILKHSVEVFDSYGRNVTDALTIMVSNNNIRFNLANLSAGVYYIRVNTGLNVINTSVVKK